MRTVVTQLRPAEDAKRSQQMQIYGIQPYGVWGFEVPASGDKPAVIFDAKRDVRRNWHAALSEARARSLAAQAAAHKVIPFNTAQLIQWGYETGGDYDEALRVYVEHERTQGGELDTLGIDWVAVRAAFVAEFGDAGIYNEASEPLAEGMTA